MVFLLLVLGLLAIYYLIRFQVCRSRVRYLVDAYGLDRRKLGKLSCKETKALRNSIDALRHADDAFRLEALIRPYRA
jgi:hypothetical protein